MNAVAPTPIRTFLLDDHQVVLHGMSVRLSLEPDIAIVGVASDSRQLLDALSHNEVDVLVFDYSLRSGDIDGLNLIRLLHIRFPKIRVLVLSVNYSPDTVKLALKTGARGYVSKRHDLDEVVLAIRTLASGGRYLHPAMAAQLAAIRRNSVASQEEGIDPLLATKLTAREHEVVRCILEGMSTSEIAAKLRRAVNTVSTHKAGAFRKLGVSSDFELLSMHRGSEKK